MNNFAINFTYSQEEDKSINERFQISYKPANRKISRDDFYTECINTAKFIRASTDKELIVANSGGLDSEIVCRSFIAAEIPFRVVTVSHKDGTNKHDIEYSIEFCKKYNVPITILELDIADFVSSKIEKYISEGFRGIRFFRFFQLFLLENITNMGGCGILGGGEQIYHVSTSLDSNHGSLSCVFEPSHKLSLEWGEKNQQLHFPYFFQSNPEIILSYLNHEIVNSLINKPLFFKKRGSTNTSHYLKQTIYHHYFSNLTPRIKYHGFENIQSIVDEVNKNLRLKFPDLQYRSKSILEIKKELLIKE